MHRTSVAYWNQRARMGIMYAPPGEGGGAGEEGEEGEEGEGEDTQGGSESEDDPEIKLDGVDAITKLFAATGNEDDEDDDSGEKILTADEVNTLLEDGLKKVVIPESIFPEDFNPNDKKSMATLLTNAVGLGVRHALNLSFRPIENAMKAHAKEVRSDVRGRIKGIGDATSTEKFLARELPASQNPKYSAIVTSAWTRALELHPKPEDRPKALAMVKQGLKAMQINPDDAGESSNNRKGESGGALRTGKDALDAYAPIRKSASTANGLKKP